MKYLIVLALIALASATHFKPTQVVGELSEIQQILEAIHSPHTDPATAAALEALLFDMLGIEHSPEPIAVGPVIIEEPVVTDPIIVSPVLPTPVAPESPASPASPSSPLVQIILNVNQAASSPGLTPGVVGNPIIDVPDTVNIVDQAPDTVNVVDQAPDTVNIVDQAPDTVNVVDQAPETIHVVDQAPEGVIVVQPILPTPVINVPEDLN